MLHSYLGGGGGLIAAAAEVDQPRDIDMGRHQTGAGCIVAEGVGPTGRVGRSKTLCVCRCNARVDELVVATFNAKDDANAVRVDALDRRSIPRRMSFIRFRSEKPQSSGNVNVQEMAALIFPRMESSLPSRRRISLSRAHASAEIRSVVSGGDLVVLSSCVDDKKRHIRPNAVRIGFLGRRHFYRVGSAATESASTLG
jgi:hypothetical protein